MSVMVDQLVGMKLGEYRVEQLLGQGSLSAVYIVKQEEQNRQAMITVFLLPEACVGKARERFMERFTQVASALVRLRHANILPIYDFGEQMGQPYLVTPLAQGGSLAKLPQQRKRCAPQEVSQILKQAAEGLDYAHSNSIVHGTLKPANILLENTHQAVQIAGFGLNHILQMRGIGQVKHTYPHLFSVAGTLLVSPEHVAPEVVQGAMPDERADVYALGAILFELLSGRPLFTGASPLETAVEHVNQPIPSLQVLYPDVPAALDLVIQKALERDPANRFQTAGKLASAFERVLGVIQGAAKEQEGTGRGNMVWRQEAEATMPPTVNWFAEEQQGASKEPQAQPGVQSARGVSSGRMPAIGGASSGRIAAIGGMPSGRAPGVSGGEAENWQLKPPIMTNKMAAVQAGQQAQTDAQRVGAESGNNLYEKESDPFVWWSTGALPSNGAVGGPAPGTFDLNTGARVEVARQEEQKGRKSKQKRGTKQKSVPPPKQRRDISAKKSSRRTIVIAAGGVVAAGVLGIGGISVLQALRNRGGTGAAMQPTTPSGMTNVKPAPTKSAAPTQAPAKKATQPKKSATTTQAGHTGTVIGATSQAMNSAKTFVVPANKQNSILIHLTNGQFVAYGTTCTHQGVTVYYDTPTQKLICPLHHSIFDPANGAAVLSGPAPSPLPKVTIKVNSDGTITV